MGRSVLSRRASATRPRRRWTATFLVEQARLLTEAIVRTLVRLFVTRRHLLEWETAAATEQRLGNGLAPCLRSMWLSPPLAVVLGLVLGFTRPGLAAAAPFLAAWLVAPFVAFWVSRPPHRGGGTDHRGGRGCCGGQARKTWAFFETFVLEQDNWLPPDNYQEEPRRSPTARRPPTWAVPVPASPPTTSAIQFSGLARPAGKDVRHVRPL